MIIDADASPSRADPPSLADPPPSQPDPLSPPSSADPTPLIQQSDLSAWRELCNQQDSDFSDTLRIDQEKVSMQCCFEIINVQ